MNRRKFIYTGAAGLAAITAAQAGLSFPASFTQATVDQVSLGNTGLVPSRMAFGTGTVGYNKGSNQTRLGMDAFVRMARHAYDRGITFFEMADGYGSHPYVGESIKTMPREKLTLLSKIWTYDDGDERQEPVAKTLDRFRSEIGTDYIDIVMLHCMTLPDWSSKRKHYMDGLSEAKAKGIIKAVGVSCHSWEALVDAENTPWVEVLQARINPFGSHMDGSLEDVNALLGRARLKGKGTIGMKIFGEGKHVLEHEREESIRFAITEGNLDCLTMGYESIEQLDDAIERVMKYV